MEEISKTVLGWKIGVKNYEMENLCRNPELVK